MDFAPDMVIVSETSRMHYHLEKKLGSGGEGQVWLANCDDGPVAVKLIEGALTEKAQNEICMTRAALECVEGNVPRLHEASSASIAPGTAPELTIIVMEYIHGVNAGKLAEKRGWRIPEDAAAVLIREICSVLVKLHKADMIHCDVKNENILVSSEGQVYLCDFGISIIRSGNDRYTSRGTPMHMAPELTYDPDWRKSYWGHAAKPEFNQKVDIWALGITAMDLVLGRERTIELTGMMKFANAKDPVRAWLQSIASSPAPVIPDESPVSMDFRRFLQLCLVRVPDDRASAADLLRNRFLMVGEEEVIAFQAWVRDSLGERDPSLLY
mmetsp:Transcript_154811/g.288608  ORF Transcript_154811/g.288608 Transcript_154811/m.288608 type:complete len:326 (+) Transcript_154811:106-1083(+)